MSQPSTVTLKTKLAILSVGLLSFVGILVETSMNVTFPTLIKTMRVSLDTVQWLTTGYLLLTTIVMSTTAYVLKRFNPKPLFLFAALVCLLGGILCWLAPNFSVLLTGRLLQAVATGISIPLMFQLIFTYVPRNQLGTYTGLASVIVSLAPALGPTYGGILTSVWSWRAIFVGIVPLLALLAILGAFNISGKALGVGDKKFDYLGAILLAITFTSLLFTFNNAGTHGWLSPNFGLWCLWSIVMIGAMVTYAIKGRRQLIDYSILKLPILRLRLFNYFGLQFINIGLSFVLPLFAQTVLGASAMTAGLMMLPGAIVGAITGPIAGRIYDKQGPTTLLTFSAIMASAALLLFWLTTDYFTVIIMAVIYALLRVGFNTGFGTAISDGSTRVPLPQKSDQNSMFSMMQQYAGSIGTSIMSAVITGYEIHHPTVTGTIMGSKLDFLLLFVLAIAILISVLHVKRLEIGQN
ncbi:MFS transporter [Lactiplantibacillus plantarum subsp. plantarum]|uniref:MFS transporter n=1 Tax=Lactiplantibacillus plantarum TaxID=1590 RepID=UPI00062A6862|nr:MFS transporter [Lactiplantibacillus plantarum]KKX44011.1 MFS transporter permease [Lactiplantibacillus plantarum]QSE56526.1 MFS transporter [Lactiplantibacillus plantarum]QXN28386.1 MFS transporter [Lactiplantibacillus plantarum subsp. plantarum]QXN31352.1 MFS transporter [Lactiplantibacillus plantarum subsp. plantarum]UJS13730.1 MFS transporter [Lactiplantibacillus plantarum subsp. plantarum]